MISANSGPANAAINTCKPVNTDAAINVAGNVSLTPLRPSIININKNGTKKLIKPNVKLPINATCDALTPPAKFSVSVIAIGIPTAP